MKPIEVERYSRQLLLPQIGKAGHLKLSQARILIVGLGGLGCPAVQYLAAAGVGTLGLIDHDKVQLSNLHRQILYTEDDIDRTKVLAASERLRRLNSKTIVKVFNEKFTNENAEQIGAGFDILLDCTDNFAARDAINAYAVRSQKPDVFASLYRFEGTLTVFDTASGSGCYRCLYGESPAAIQNCAEAGVVGTLPGIMGTMQAMETIKIIVGASKVLDSHALIYDGLNQTMRKFKREKKENCSVCGS